MASIQAINAFNDNYIWAISDDSKPCCALVDPGDGQATVNFLSKNKLIPSAILITHKHADHIGGISTICDYSLTHGYDQPTVYGPANESTGTEHIGLVEGDTVVLDQPKITLHVLDLPGHTLGHIAYVNGALVFCGDTLFSGGCGRLFEGTTSQMLDSLAKLKALPAETKVYCAHEYTQANLEFASHVNPGNLDLAAYKSQVSQLREQGLSTIPSTIGQELAINPFLRADDWAIKAHLEQLTNDVLDDELAVFTCLRHLKDHF